MAESARGFNDAFRRSLRGAPKECALSKGYLSVQKHQCYASLEAVIRYYLNSIKTRTEEAQKESKSVLMDVEDLDILETPERLILDLLRSNAKLEHLYHEIANDDLLQVPTRQSLIHDIVRHKVPSLVPQELADLYTVLEADFQPMTLWERSQPALRIMAASPELSVYIPQLHEVLVSKVVLQLSQVYRTIRLNELVKLCPFMDPISLERSVIELIHNLELPIRINHRLQALVFDEFTDLGISQCDYGGQLVSQSTHVNAPDRLSRQLTMFAQVMQQITEMLEGNQQLPDYRRALVSEYQACRRELHMELLNRRTYIEARKEQVEHIQGERDQIYMEEEARRQAELERRMQSEELNLQKEAEERERRKTEDEQARIRRRIALGNYNLLMEHKIGIKLDSKDLTEEQLDQFDADKILEKKALEVNKKRKELTEKAKAMAKKLDYYTRACRLEELPLLMAAVEPEAEKSREEHERSMREIEEHSKAEHERQLAEKNRLIRMKADVQVSILFSNLPNQFPFSTCFTVFGYNFYPFMAS
ncbi:unnamed protein product [Echinostoma caproni]|uniref:Eukaryotic translation initiation factor 3 subunit A n=1 Tax=Echinostoma caproni TaxID=27848 RepID=A0A183B549_9TREM|nr:unnamed protein product [Echinostoma caproni]